LAADGPEQKPADERDAELAGAAEVARGGALFGGRTRLASGGLACGACHTVSDHGRRTGGTLGPELTNTYLKYRDRALTLFLKHPCTPRQPELGSGRYRIRVSLPHGGFYSYTITVGDRVAARGTVYAIPR